MTRMVGSSSPMSMSWRYFIAPLTVMILGGSPCSTSRGAGESAAVTRQRAQMGRTAIRIENLVQRGDTGGRGGSWRCIVGSEVSIEAARHVRFVESPPAGEGGGGRGARFGVGGVGKEGERSVGGARS